MGDRFNDIARRASQRISPLLTPEQRKILDDLDRQREERFRDAFKQRSTD
jgi:Spy/CpxP family protein refolding chaperone